MLVIELNEKLEIYIGIFNVIFESMGKGIIVIDEIKIMFIDALIVMLVVMNGFIILYSLELSLIAGFMSIMLLVYVNIIMI